MHPQKRAWSDASQRVEALLRRIPEIGKRSGLVFMRGKVSPLQRLAPVFEMRTNPGMSAFASSNLLIQWPVIACLTIRLHISGRVRPTGTAYA